MALGKHNVRVKALAATHRREPRQRPGRAGDRLRARGQHRAAGRRTCAFPARSAFPKPRSRRRSSTPPAAFARHGFRDIVLIGDHGGYQKSLVKVADKLNREWAASPVRVHAIEEYYRAAERDFAQALKRSRASAMPRSAPTPALADTSLMLAVDPSLVRIDAPARRQRARRRPTACRAIRAVRAPGRPSRRRPDRRANARRDPARGRAALTRVVASPCAAL